jgi:pyridoxal/pyridoxine/pyridoxamine kinase
MSFAHSGAFFHSGFPGFHFVDLTDHLEPMIEHWKKMQLQFDAIYSGYLGSATRLILSEILCAISGCPIN